jgi:drug/metabolite transporter (DMT)-like permease
MALVAFPMAQPFGLPWQSYAVLAVMGMVQMPVALVLMAVGTRYLPAPEVSLYLLVEAVLAPVWVWLAVGEAPPWATFLGGAVIIATLAIHSWLSLMTAQRRVPRP